MKIGIITQPLLNNYGGILQNFALQQTLIQLGHEPITFDYDGRRVPLYRYILSNAIRVLFKCFGKKYRAVQFKDTLKMQRKGNIENFIYQNIHLTKYTDTLTSSLIMRHQLDAIIAGSDQIWRPMYNWRLEDMYLRFARKQNIKKIIYAASFGTDKWEYSKKQTARCKKLAKKLDAISVREDSGVLLCQKFLEVDAIEVLDPTLLIEQSNYNKLCADIPVEKEPFIAAYILDLTDSKKNFIKKFSKEKGYRLKIIRADKHSIISIEEWLAMFRDATFIITDSFHGTVFSIIYNKQFIAITNKWRGGSRFRSLLRKFDLEEYLIDDCKTTQPKKEIPWQQINQQREVLKGQSIQFLIRQLKK